MAAKPIILADHTFLARENLRPAPEPCEDGWRTGEDPDSFEWWYFDAEFNDGTSAVIIFSTKEPVMRSGPLRPTVRVTITPGRTRGPLEQVGTFERRDFKAQVSHCEVEIGPKNSIRSDDERYEVHAEAGGLAVDLTFTRRLPPWRPDCGKMYFGHEGGPYFAWLAAVPFATVEGSLTYDGASHPVADGIGYHDHNWGNVDLPKVFSHWYWGRAYIGEYSLIFVEMVASRAYGGQRIPIYMLARGGEIVAGRIAPLGFRRLARERDPARVGSAWRYPRSIDFPWITEDGAIQISLRAPRVINSRRLIKMIPRFNLIPWWKRLLLILFFKGHYFRFQAEGRLVVNFNDGRRDIHARRGGTALYELAILS
jgi:hypothetical protein